MKVHGTFKVSDFKPASLEAAPKISTALPVGVSTMTKTYAGDISGQSATLFTSAFDPAQGIGSYVAMESFEGSVAGRAGSVNFLHSASTKGRDRANEFFAIVEGSGTGDLAGMTGTGGIAIDPDGTHRIWFDCEFAS